jgi:hypothetical protein
MPRYLAIYLLFALPSCTCNDLAGPGAQLTQAARDLEQTPSLQLQGGRLQITHLKLTRITAEPELTPPRVVFSLDLEGQLQSGPRLSVLGVERQPMVLKGSVFVVQGPLFPGLQAALRAMPPLPANRLVMRLELHAATVTAELADGTRQSVTLSLSPDGGAR